MPSFAFKQGLYGRSLTVGEARQHGDFGVGEYELLDGEVTGMDGAFFRQTAEGKLLPLSDDEPLCFASVARFRPVAQINLAGPLTETTVQPVLLEAFKTPMTVFAMRIDGYFEQLTATAIPRQASPFVTFDKVGHTQFQYSQLAGTLVCFYVPDYMAQTGIGGFHYHFLASDRTGGGHVTNFSLREGIAQWQRIETFALHLPRSEAFDNAHISSPATP
jgi:acetolactate decarboxylase